MLQGKCGRVLDRHMSQCAPCHLPISDVTMDPSLAVKPSEAACEQCTRKESTTDNPMLVCDFCDAGWHIHRLDPPLTEVPEGDWICPRCVLDGITESQLHAKIARRSTEQQLNAGSPNLYPDKQMRQRDAAAQQLHGRLILQNFMDPVTKRLRPYWGRLHFKGDKRRPRYFDVHFEDGDIHDYTMTEVKPYLQPDGTVLPVGVTLAHDTEFAEQASSSS